MTRFTKLITLWAALLAFPYPALADGYPTIAPSATFVDSEATEESGTTFSGSAPISAEFFANAENTEGWKVTYEWRFTKEGNESPYLIRYEENTTFVFSESGSHHIVLYATFIQGQDTIRYTSEYWAETDPIVVTVSESVLNMPNGFSPNGDRINDVYRAKPKDVPGGYKSIVEFHATIYNRWGQKLYSWDDPAGGWDGKYKGKPVAQGVYFVEVKALGADGRKYHIRKDVNLLRGYTDTTSTGGTTTE